MKKSLKGTAGPEKILSDLLLWALNGNSIEGIILFRSIRNNRDKITDFVYSYINKKAEELLGGTKLSGKHFLSIFPEARASGLFDKYVNVVLSGVPLDEEIRIDHNGNDSRIRVKAEKFEDGCLVIYSDARKSQNKEYSIHMEEALVKEATLNSILTNSDECIYSINLQTEKIEYISPSVKNVTGYTADEILGMDMTKIKGTVHPEYRKDLYSAHEVCEKCGKAEIEYLCRSRSGEYVWIYDSMNVKKDANGVPLYLYGKTKNITGRKKIEKALSDSEQRFRTIVETANEGIVQVDGDFRIIYVNSKLATMGGFSVSELMGKSIFDFMKEESKSMLKKKLLNITPGTKRSYELKLIKKGGGDIIVSVNAIALSNEDGKYTGSIGMITDITEKISIERDLKRTKKKLENALENGRIGTWEWNIRTGEIILDRRTEEMFGVKPGAFDGKASGFDNFVHEEDIQHVHDIIDKSLTSVHPFEVIFRTRPHYGKSNYISAKALVTRDKKGRPVSMSGVCFDVTDMKEGAEKALIKLNEDLLRSNSDLQQFAYVASHDLQEPLRMISSFTQLLQHRYQNRLDEDANEYIHYAVEGSKRMYALLNGLLAYSRVHTRGKEFGEVNMNNVVERVKDNLRLVIGETHAVIKCDNLPVISADDNQMIQLMQNLIENGIKFSKGVPGITISSVQKGDYIVFSIRDEGIGIEPQYFERIFKIFQKLHRSDEYGGTGIGLAICKRIAERHGGRIWVSSDPGSGSTFYFSIPRKRKMSL